jgi:hypothetical protein
MRPLAVALLAAALLTACVDDVDPDEADVTIEGVDPPQTDADLAPDATLQPDAGLAPADSLHDDLPEANE